jgi:hypothetical protein
MLKKVGLFLLLFVIVPTVTVSAYGQYRDPFAQKDKSKQPKKKKVKTKIVKEKRLNKNDDPFVSKKTGTPYNKKYEKQKNKKKAGTPGKKKKLINRNKKRAVKAVSDLH